MKISVQASCLPLALLAIPSILSPDHAFANAAPVEHELEACPRHAPLVVDVAVVGGGFSGMASAYALHQAGLKTVVLEAHDKLGGRSRTHQLQSGPGVIELGATWINNLTQPEVFALTEEFGLHTIEQYTEGIDVTQLVDGSVDRGEGTGEPVSCKRHLATRGHSLADQTAESRSCRGSRTTRSTYCCDD